MLEKIECCLSSYLKNIWTEMTLCHIKSNRLDDFTSFAADNIGLHDKKKGNCDVTKEFAAFIF